MTEHMLTTEEAAAVLGKSTETIRRWIRSHELPATKAGGTYLIRRGDLPGQGPARVPDGHFLLRLETPDGLSVQVGVEESLLRDPRRSKDFMHWQVTKLLRMVDRWRTS